MVSHRDWSFTACVLVFALLGARGASADLCVGCAAVWQDAPGFGIVGTLADFDRFGSVLAAGDFNGDGYDDVAIADQESSILQGMGAVHVLYSNFTGLSAFNAYWTDFNPGTGLSDEEFSDAFGSALASGDFNGDGFDDLAIGIRFEDATIGPGTYTNCGAVLILYGSSLGLVADNADKFFPGAPGDRSFVYFGWALTAGDFDGDGRDDLAIAAPWADVGSQEYAGLVSVYRGSATGLIDAPSHFHQDSSDANGTMLDASEANDHFGQALAAGDFDANGADDLAIGVVGESQNGESAAGVVQILRGLPGVGLTLANNQLWNQANIFTGETIENGDQFGFALAVGGDMSDDDADDLLIGSPYEDVLVGSNTFVDAGAVTVLFGSNDFGITTFHSETYYQDDFALGESSEHNDSFGWSIAVADFSGDGWVDVAIGAPGEGVVDPTTFQTWSRAGAVTVVQGGPSNLRPGTARFLAEEWWSHRGELAVNDAYGMALVAGDFDGNGHPDLAVGAPGEDASDSSGTIDQAGALFVLYGALFSDGFEFGNTGMWSSVTP